MSAYDILGLTHNATPDEIKKAYKKLALQYHPDKNSDKSEEEKLILEEKFKQVSKAYREITGADEQELAGEFREFNDLFKMMMSGMSGLGINAMNGMNSSVRGPDVRVSLDLTLEELYTGGTYEVEVEVKKPTGKYIQTMERNGPFVLINKQPEYIQSKEKIKVEIYPGYDPDIDPLVTKLVHETGENMVIICVNQKPHNVFERLENELKMNLQISLKESLLGFERIVKHVNGQDICIKCESIVNPYDEKIFPGLGIKPSGSLIIKFIIEFPTMLSDEQRIELGHLL
jgi:DnaJ-class molecular chaperone